MVAFNRIMLGDVPIIDLTADTVTVDKVLLGTTFHGITGEILTGTMTNNGATNSTISTINDTFVIPAGYHNGSGIVAIDNVEQAKIIAENIKDGVTILGVQGTYKGVTLTPVVPNATNITHYWMPRTNANLYLTISYEEKTNTRSDEYIVEAGKSYLARFIAPYGAWCQTALSKISLIDNTSNVTNCSRIAPDKYYGNIFFTAPINCYLIMYKDDTSNDNFLTECFEVMYE